MHEFSPTALSAIGTLTAFIAFTYRVSRLLSHLSLIRFLHAEVDFKPPPKEARPEVGMIVVTYL